jgi:hypothetical protein
VIINSSKKAYPLKALRKKGTITDRLDKKEITLTFNPKTDVLRIKDKQGKDIPYITSYWFVWKGIHPETTLYLQ